MYVCMFACMNVCMYACMHVCMYACMKAHSDTHGVCPRDPVGVCVLCSGWGSFWGCCAVFWVLALGSMPRAAMDSTTSSRTRSGLVKDWDSVVVPSGFYVYLCQQWSSSTGQTSNDNRVRSDCCASWPLVSKLCKTVFCRCAECRFTSGYTWSGTPHRLSHSRIT